ncbi:hypothetical protein [Herbiconiux sp. A18JL235]|uniref:Major facilitator superfamily (MFS) profile domain-containing protein n=1 Tax=Herbiconiux sp. A18JL235 TaxID=3152363 RepID=A0AB39BFQ8_9MICO
MSLAAVLFFVPSALLVLAGVAIVVFALRNRCPGRAGGVATVLRLLAGAGTLGLAVVAVSPLWSGMQYGIVILPVAALCAAALLNAVLLGAAALVLRIRR